MPNPTVSNGHPGSTRTCSREQDGRHVGYKLETTTMNPPKNYYRPCDKLSPTYYDLYKRAKPRDDDFDCSKKVVASGSRLSTTSSVAEAWIPDRWTEEEEKAAAMVLLANEEKCRLPSSTLAPNAESWDTFYHLNTTKFFQDRHYLSNAFPSEFGPSSSKGCWVELGCGVGNACLPTVQQWKTVYAVDCSKVAIEHLRKDSRCKAAGGRLHAIIGDISKLRPALGIQSSSADVTSLLFCLSALATAEERRNAVSHVRRITRGCVVFRDYGRFDQAQMQLATQRHKLVSENTYRKHDGTICHYFSLVELRELFPPSRWEELELRFLQRKSKNRLSGSNRRRVWVQARFRKRSDDDI